MDSSLFRFFLDRGPLVGYGSDMFLTARNVLTDYATRRQLPFTATVAHDWRGETILDATGTSVEYLAEHYNDARSLWGNARIISNLTGEVLFRG